MNMALYISKYKKFLLFSIYFKITIIHPIIYINKIFYVSDISKNYLNIIVIFFLIY